MAARTGYVWWGESVEDDITKLPKNYEARVSDDDRVYYVNHERKETHWENPINNLRYKVTTGLSYGWQKFKDDEDCIVYVDHLSQMCTSVDPRLLSKAVYDFPLKYSIKDYTSIKNFFHSLVKADDVMKSVSMEGKVVIVTGANSGLGYQTALSIAKQGAQVILACRNASLAKAAISKIREDYPAANVEFLYLDLSSLQSVKSFADEFISRDMPLHVLICNAGVLLKEFSVTTDGVETHFGVNHLGHFYLCNLLAPVLVRSKPSRVVLVTSESHWYPSTESSTLDLHLLRHPDRKRYSPITAYGASKLCNLLFMLEFNRRHVEMGVACTAVHPGNLLPTRLSSRAGLFYRTVYCMARPFTKSVMQGASGIVYCACHPSMKGISGIYVYECWPAEPSPEAQNLNTATALWDLSQQIVEEKTLNFSRQDTSNYSVP